MSILSNIKAQSSKVFKEASQIPVAKGVKNLLYEEGLASNQQRKILQNMSESHKNSVNALKNVNKGNKDKAYMNSLEQAINHNVGQIDEQGIASLNEKQRARLSKRFAKNPEMATLQEQAIINNARVKSYMEQGMSNGVPIGINGEQAVGILNQAAQEVNNNLGFLTPLQMAQEYYGTPIMGVVNGIRQQDNQLALHSLAKAGARVGATGLAVGATTTALQGTANLTRRAVDRLKGNSYEY